MADLAHELQTALGVADISEPAWLAVGGAAMLPAYAIHRGGQVFILGQSMGFAIHARSIWLIHAEKHGLGAH